MPFWYCAGMTLDDFLKAEPKLSHAAFGQKIGVSQATVTRYANGKRKPSLAMALKIEEVTRRKVKVSDWLSDAAEREGASA